MSQNTNLKALKSGAWYTISNFFSTGLLFLATPLFTRLMNKNDVGQYANFSSYAAIVGSIVTFDLYSSIVPAKYTFREKLDDFIGCVLILGIIITSFFYFFTLVFFHQAEKMSGLSPIEINTLFVVSMMAPASQIYINKCRLEYKYKASTVLTLISSLLPISFSLAGVILMQNKYLGRLLGFYLPQLVINSLVFIYLIRKASQYISLAYWKFALKISLPMLWHILSAQLLSSCDRIMINRICGSEDAAYYSVAYSCATMVAVLCTSMFTAWSPWVYEKFDSNDYAIIKDYSKPFLLLFLFVSGIMLLLAPEVLLLAGGRSYSEALFVIPPVIIAFIMQFYYTFLMNIEVFYKKQNYIAIGTTIAGVVNVILNLVFIKIFGYIAASYTTLIGYAVMFIVHYFFVRHMKKDKIYDIRFFAVTLTACILFSAFVMIIYRYNIIRYALAVMMITVLSVLVYHNKTRIAKLLKGPKKNIE